MLDDSIDATVPPDRTAAARHAAAIEARRAAVERQKRRRRVLVDGVLGLLALLLLLTGIGVGRIALAGDPLATWNRFRDGATTVALATDVESRIGRMQRHIDALDLQGDLAQTSRHRLAERIESFEKRFHRDATSVLLSFDRGTLPEAQLAQVAYAEFEGWLYDRHGEAARMIDRKFDLPRLSQAQLVTETVRHDVVEIRARVTLIDAAGLPLETRWLRIHRAPLGAWNDQADRTLVGSGFAPGDASGVLVLASRDRS